MALRFAVSTSCFTPSFGTWRRLLGRIPYPPYRTALQYLFPDIELLETASFIKFWNTNGFKPYLAGLEVSRLPYSPKVFFAKHPDIFKLITSVHASPFTSFGNQLRRGWGGIQEQIRVLFSTVPK